MIRAYHFVGPKLRDSSPVPKDGEWLRVKGAIKICHSGLHASKHVSDALSFAPGNTLCLVDMSQDIFEQDDKLVARCRRIVARFDATELLRADARASALSVAHLWKMPEILRQYLETGDETIRQAARAAAYAAAHAAYDAAYDAAAYAAARAAYDAAAYAAAYAAARAAYDAAAYAAYDAASRKVSRDRLQAAVDAKFKELLS